MSSVCFDLYDMNDNDLVDHADVYQLVIIFEIEFLFANDIELIHQALQQKQQQRQRQSKAERELRARIGRERDVAQKQEHQINLMTIGENDEDIDEDQDGRTRQHDGDTERNDRINNPSSSAFANSTIDALGGFTDRTWISSSPTAATATTGQHDYASLSGFHSARTPSSTSSSRHSPDINGLTLQDFREVYDDDDGGGGCGGGDVK